MANQNRDQEKLLADQTAETLAKRVLVIQEVARQNAVIQDIGTFTHD